METNHTTNFYEVRHEVPNKGKALYCTSAISSGVALFEEEPIVSSQFLWNAFYKYTACEYCMKSLETAQNMAGRLTNNQELVLPHPECCAVKPELHTKCQACGVDYCSEKCQKSAWEKYHKTLCLGQSVQDPSHPINKLQDIWRNVHYPPESCSIMLIAKMIALVQNSSNKEAVLQLFSQFTKATTNEEEHIGHKLLGAKYQDQLDSMNTQLTEALYCDDLQQWFTPEGFRSLFALIGTNGQGIGTSSVSVWINNCDKLELPADERTALEIFINQLVDDLEEVSAQFQDCEGSGLYALQSCSNHSCQPNAEVTFPYNNSTLVLKAISDIAPGEEICISYLDCCQLERSRHSRQKYLRENYLFQCSCEKCIAQADDPDMTSEDEMEDEDEEEH